eukprot:gnl/TRDRNA2_/TRDRNA2_192091_c0_seq1.p1 gnl/TRDRNA2_/TRDRNA2_192091_c0~~gnl/TRDRNA2_/TRDRNA2_192091_c0_seq1.p1  ORF type:complete len:168 (-),score=23.44 gnl/TRDRNA2_/TRDRNA2_192091_c0_seq1:175-678(-)
MVKLARCKKYSAAWQFRKHREDAAKQRGARRKTVQQLAQKEPPRTPRKHRGSSTDRVASAIKAVTGVRRIWERRGELYCPLTSRKWTQEMLLADAAVAPGQRCLFEDRFKERGKRDEEPAEVIEVTIEISDGEEEGEEESAEERESGFKEETEQGMSQNDNDPRWFE